jgi:hypothetical protein
MVLSFSRSVNVFGTLSIKRMAERLDSFDRQSEKSTRSRLVLKDVRFIASTAFTASCADAYSTKA